MLLKMGFDFGAEESFTKVVSIASQGYIGV